jgi:hypothetical protein
MMAATKRAPPTVMSIASQSSIGARAEIARASAQINFRKRKLKLRERHRVRHEFARTAGNSCWSRLALSILVYLRFSHHAMVAPVRKATINAAPGFSFTRRSVEVIQSLEDPDSAPVSDNDGKDFCPQCDGANSAIRFHMMLILSIGSGSRCFK